MKKFEMTHNGNVIVVENRLFSERLYVNGELQDERMGLNFGMRLWGQLSTGESIKVSLGGAFTIGCRVFIDHTLVFSK